MALRCSELQAELEAAERRAAHAEEQRAALAAPASGGVDEAELQELRARIAELEKEAAGAATARQQLAKLKQQLLTEPERLRWRLDAEVKLELERRLAELPSGAMAGAGDEAETRRWRELALAREAELANLTRALDELSYESEAAERLRGEVVALNAALHAAKNDGDAARLAALRAQETAEGAQGRAEHLAATLAATQREGQAAAAALAEERHAREALARKVEALRADAGTSIDRRIVVKMLVAFCERQGSDEVVTLMQRMLGLSDEERGKLSASAREWGRQRGPSRAGDVIGTVPTRPGSSLATSWIDFLEEAAAAEDDVVGDALPASAPPVVAEAPASATAPAPYVPLAPTPSPYVPLAPTPSPYGLGASAPQLFAPASRSTRIESSQPASLWGGPGAPAI